MKITNSIRSEIARTLEESTGIKMAIAQSGADKIDAVVKAVIAAYKKGGKVVLFGNGGSVADAQHIASEMVGQFLLKRQAFSAIALTAKDLPAFPRWVLRRKR